jgi:uncharacterized alkaline shock family protein YloU
MNLADKINTINEEHGVLSYADDVIATISGLAAVEIDGVSSMCGNIGNGIAELLGRKTITKGVKVEVGKEEAAIDLFLIVEYGAKIPSVIDKVQKNVTKAVETMTGLKVVEVNVNVQGVHITNEEEKVDKSEQVEKKEKKVSEKRVK